MLEHKELPNAPEMEKAVIAAVLSIPANIHKCLQLLKPQCFYNTKRSEIWAKLLEMYHNGQVADGMSLLQHYQETSQPNTANIVIELITHNFPNDITTYVSILYDKYVRRCTIMEAMKMIQDAHNGHKSIRNIISESSMKLIEASSPAVSKIQDANEAMLEEARRINDNLGKFQEVTGVPTGFEGYDKRLGGFSAGDLITIAARPGMGKTSVTLDMAKNACYHFGYSGLFFSLEMTTQRLVRKIMSSETGVSTDRLRKNSVDSFSLDTIFDTCYANQNRRR